MANFRFRPSFALTLLLLAAASGCGKKENTTQSPPPAPTLDPAPPIQVDSSGWLLHEQHSQDGAVQLTRSQMPEQQRERVRNEYRRTSLVAIPVDPFFNVSIFKIKEIPEWANTFFIAPRLYAYGSAEGGRVAPQRHPDGTVSFSFPVVLTDGTQNTIPSPDGRRDITLPPAFLIKDLNRLRTTLGTATGSASTLSSLPGCPTRLLLKINDREIDVTPSDLAFGDYCQMNKPFNVTARLPEEEARYMLEDALYANAVEARAVYETRAAFVDSRATVSFSKSKIFRALEAELQVRAGPWADIDAQAHLKDIVKNEALTIDIQGDAGPVVDNIVDQASRIFFEKYNSDPATGLKECSNAVACVRLNYNYDKQQDSFTFSWTHSTSFLTGQNYLTWTQLAPLLDHVVSIGNGVRADGNPRPELSSQNRAGIESGLTVVPGDLLEITPAYLVREQREFDIPQSSLESHPVCIQMGPPTYEQHCHRHCSGGGGPGGGNRECDMECAPTYVPPQCVRLEDHWIRTITYGRSAPQFLKVDQPIGQMQQIFDGMALKFVWRTPSTNTVMETTCPLNLFSRVGDGKSLLVRLENRGFQCNIFSGDPSVQPMLYLLNRISSPVVYKTGKEVVTWDGRTLEVPSQATYDPETRFAGTISIRGYSFAGSSSDGHRVP